MAALPGGFSNAPALHHAGPAYPNVHVHWIHSSHHPQTDCQHFERRQTVEFSKAAIRRSSRPRSPHYGRRLYTRPQTKPINSHIPFEHTYFNLRGHKPGGQLRLWVNLNFVGGRPIVPRCNDLVDPIIQGNAEYAPVETKCHFAFFGEPREFFHKIAPKGSGIVPVDKALWADLIGPLPFLGRALLACWRHQVPVPFPFDKPIRQRF